MKLALKLYLIFSGVLFITTIFYGYSTYKREINFYEKDMKEDMIVFGNAVVSQVSSMLQANDIKMATELIDRANHGERKISIRLIWLKEKADSLFRPRIPFSKLSNVLNGKTGDFMGNNDKGEQFLFLYIPLKTDNNLHGALELAESYSFLKEYSHVNTRRLIFKTFLILIINFFLTGIAGYFILGKRVKRVSDFASVIGKGDWEGKLIVRGNDEISSLSNSMNDMCRHLKIIQEKLVNETDARVEAIEQLKHTERLALLGRISSGVAHELGTPLNVVGGRAKLITKEELTDEEIVDSARIIMEQTKHMTGIIQQMLKFARRSKPNKTNVDLLKLLEDAVVLVDAIAKKHGVSLKLTDKTHEKPLVLVDKTQIQQVLINIIINGIQAMPDGGLIELEIETEKKQETGDGKAHKNNFVIIRIKDNGPGIADEDQERIFEPFYSTKPAGKGTGLGLSIAAEIMQDHNGRLIVESKLKNGSCFSIYLPTGDIACVER